MEPYARETALYEDVILVYKIVTIEFELITHNYY
jgi:hypothetical protein